MIAVSNTLKQACNSESLFYKEYIVIDNTTIEIKGKMSNTAYKNTTFFGTFNLKMLEFTTENDINYKKKTFTYWKSVNGEAFKIGSYIVTDIKDNDSTEEVTVTAMDYGLKFAIPYTTSLNYASGTVTLYDVLEECCTNAGVELENLTIANGDFIVDGNQFVNGEQIGTVVANIAGICGDFATINENDKLELIFYKKTETIDSVNLITEDGLDLITEDGLDLIVVDDIEEIDDYISLDDKRDTQPITCVSLGFSNIDGEEIIRKDNDLIALYGENWLRIDDNYFAYSTAKMDLLIDNIFNKVKGFGYSSFVSKYSFKPYLQLGDMIYFKNKNGVKIRSVIFKIDTDYDDITLSAPSITNATVEYERPDDALTIAKNAQISVDKAKAEIILKADSNGHVVQAKLSASGDTGSQFTVLSDNIALEGYTTINGGAKFDLAGNFYGLKSIFEDVLIRGGGIKLNDNGSSTDSTIVVYNKNNTTKTAQTLGINDLMNSETLTLNWQNLFDIMANHPTYFVDDSGYPNLVDNELITFSNGSKIYLDVLSANGSFANISLLTYKVQYIDRLGNKTDLLYDRWSYNWSSSGSYHTTYTQLSTYSLSDDVGYVSNISDEAGNLAGYTAIFDSITYQKLLLTNYSLISSDGVTIKNNDISTRYSGNGLNITDQYGTSYFNNSNGINWQTNTGSNYKDFIAGQNGLFYTNLSYAQEFYINMAEMIFKINGNEYLKVNTSGVTSTAFNNSSLESLKKNFIKLDSGLSIIENSDIIKYNYKSEQDDDKKHIGLVIPDENGNYNTPDEIISKDGKGIDTYSMISIAWKAIQEQQKQINELKEEIKKLKESDK